MIMVQFQSTQPEWAATNNAAAAYDGFDISIHAARVGCDPDAMSDLQRIVISIHAARVGCDSIFHYLVLTRRYFNPRSPSGLRQAAVIG